MRNWAQKPRRLRNRFSRCCTRSGLTFDMRWRCSKPLWKEARRESQWTCEAGGLEERKHADKGTPLRSTLVRAQPLAVGYGVYLQECGDPPSLRFASPIFHLPSVGLSQDSQMTSVGEQAHIYFLNLQISCFTLYNASEVEAPSFWAIHFVISVPPTSSDMSASHRSKATPVHESSQLDMHRWSEYGPPQPPAGKGRTTFLVRARYCPVGCATT